MTPFHAIYYRCIMLVKKDNLTTFLSFYSNPTLYALWWASADAKKSWKLGVPHNFLNRELGLPPLFDWNVVISAIPNKHHTHTPIQIKILENAIWWSMVDLNSREVARVWMRIGKWGKISTYRAAGRSAMGKVFLTIVKISEHFWSLDMNWF